MSLWLVIPLGAGILAALIAVVRRIGDKGIYAIGIIESCLVGTDYDCLQVRAYVDETLVHALPAPSKLTGRMFIRGTDTSVPLTFDRVPPYVSPKPELSSSDSSSQSVQSLQPPISEVSGANRPVGDRSVTVTRAARATQAHPAPWRLVRAPCSM